MTQQKAELAARKSTDFTAGWSRARAAISAVAVLALVYVCHIYIPRGPVTWFLSLVPLIMVIIGSVARMSDMEVDQLNPAHNARRIGMILAATGGAVAIFQPLATHIYPSWFGLAFYWGVALKMVTDPNLPPFSKYIFKGDSRAKEYVHPERREAERNK